MKAKAYSLFGLLAIFSLIAIAPPAFADHTTAEVDMAVGSSVVGCETINECYIPHMVTIDVGGEVMWNNIDAMAHTVTAGTPTEGLSEHFDSGLVAPGAMFSHEFTEAGTFDYFCMVHPWMEGTLIVEAAGAADAAAEAAAAEAAAADAAAAAADAAAEAQAAAEADAADAAAADAAAADAAAEAQAAVDAAAAAAAADAASAEAAAEAAMAVPAIDPADYISTSGASVTSITANADDDSVIIAIDAEDDGVLSVTLHSEVITAFDDGTYFVLIDNEEVEFEQSGNSLTIPYGAGNERVEIVGCHVVPEFGTIAMIILAVAIVSIIAITAKTRTTLIPKL